MTESGAPPDMGTGVKRPGNRVVRFVIPTLSLLCVGAWPTATIDTRALAAVIQDPLSIFARRSPGERAPGAQTAKGKPSRGSYLLVKSPKKERVLSRGRNLPAQPPEVAEPDLPGAGVSPGIPGETGPLPIELAGLYSPYLPEGGGGGGGGGFFLPPVSNGPGVGVIGEPDGGGGPIIDTPTPAIPEPQTWLTMMIGLLVVGGMSRRRRTVAGVAAMPAAARLLR